MWHQWFICNFMKLWEYFLCAKKTKILTLFSDFVSSVSVSVPFTRVPRCMCVPSSACKQGAVLPGSTSAASHAKKVFIFVFFVQRKYSRSFINLRLKPWCHMDSFNDVLTTFLGLELDSCVAVYAGSERKETLKNILICGLKMNEDLRGL